MQTGTTMLLVSHDLEEAVYLADQVLLLTKRPDPGGRDPALRGSASAHRGDAVGGELHRHQEAQPGDLPARSPPLKAVTMNEIETYRLRQRRAALMGLPLDAARARRRGGASARTAAIGRPARAAGRWCRATSRPGSTVPARPSPEQPIATSGGADAIAPEARVDHDSHPGAVDAVARRSAREALERCMARIERHRRPGQRLHRQDLRERALRQAAAVDARRAARREPPRCRCWACPTRSRTCSTSQAMSRWPARRSIASSPPASADAFLVQRMRGRRRGAGGRAQHGRVRLRLHHREHPLRRLPQPARPGAHRRRLVGRLGRGRGGRAGADHARLGHQRLDPRAGVAVRRVGA